MDATDQKRLKQTFSDIPSSAVPMEGAMRENERERLDSWKEIADYLRREIRTAMRWERQKGLPVRRVPGGKRHAVRIPEVYPKSSMLRHRFQLGFGSGPAREPS